MLYQAAIRIHVSFTLLYYIGIYRVLWTLLSSLRSFGIKLEYMPPFLRMNDAIFVFPGILNALIIQIYLTCATQVVE